MSRLTCLAVAAAFALATSAPAAAAEDLTIVSKVTSGKGAPTTSTQYISSNKIRTSTGETDSIMDVAAGRITVVNHKDKSYVEFTMDEMRASLAALEQQMAGPMGAMMEKMMGGKPGEVTVTKTGAPRTVAGYSCDTYVVSMGENMRQEVCATTALQIPVNFYDAQTAAYAMMGPLARRFEKFFSEMKKIEGFPIATSTTFKMGPLNTTGTAEATEIKKGPIADSVFAPPAGYKKKDSPFKQR